MFEGEERGVSSWLSLTPGECETVGKWLVQLGDWDSICVSVWGFVLGDTDVWLVDEEQTVSVDRRWSRFCNSHCVVWMCYKLS